MEKKKIRRLRISTGPRSFPCTPQRGNLTVSRFQSALKISESSVAFYRACRPFDRELRCGARLFRTLRYELLNIIEVTPDRCPSLIHNAAVRSPAERPVITREDSRI